MAEYTPLLIVGAIIGVFTVLFTILYVWDSRKKETRDFERHMSDAEIVRRLLEAGKSGDTPAAVLSGGNAPHPVTIRAALQDIEAAAKDAVSPVVILVGGVAAMGFQMSCQQAFVALGQARFSVLFACLRKLVLLIPMIYLLPLFFADKPFAVFLAEPVSDVLAAAATCTSFFLFFRKLK